MDSREVLASQWHGTTTNGKQAEMSIRSRSARGFSGKSQQATEGRTSIKILLSCLLFALFSGTVVVSPWQVDEAALSSVSSSQKVSAMTRTSNTPQAQAPQATTSEMKRKMKSTSSSGGSERKSAPRKEQQKANDQQQQPNKKCDYDKGQWNECQADGSQQKVMRLKAGGRDECKSSKTIRRDCKTAAEVGCKYARGEWSDECQAGQRVRVDTLVGLVQPDGKLVPSHNSDQLLAVSEAKCKPQRRVTKDCRRTCHYIKSAWNECGPDGFKTRLLTLEEGNNKLEPAAPQQLQKVTSTANAAGATPETEIKRDGSHQLGTPTSSPSLASVKRDRGRRHSPAAAPGGPEPVASNPVCARQKLIRRECKAKQQPVSQQQQQQQQQQTSTQTPVGTTMKQLQRRRLKQIRHAQQQQQQQQQLATSSVVTNTVKDQQLRG